MILDEVNVNKLNLKDKELYQFETCGGNAGLFVLNPTEVGRTNLVQHHLILEIILQSTNHLEASLLPSGLRLKR